MSVIVRQTVCEFSDKYISQTNRTLNDRIVFQLLFDRNFFTSSVSKTVEMNDEKVIIEGEVKQRMSRKVRSFNVFSQMARSFLFSFKVEASLDCIVKAVARRR